MRYGNYFLLDLSSSGFAVTFVTASRIPTD